MTNPAAIFGADNASTLLQNALVTQDGQEISSGRSRNFIRNNSGVRNTDGWVTTGTIAVVRTVAASEIVDGPASLKFSGGAVNDTAKYAFKINNAQKNGSLSLSFDFIVQSGNSGDFIVEFFDVTANALVYSNVTAIVQTGAATGYFLAGNNVDYELRVTRKAGSGTFSAANFDVYKGRRASGSSDTDWVSFVPTAVGFGAISLLECYKRKNGTDLLLDLRFAAGTPDPIQAKIILPDNLTTGPSAGSGHTCGTWERNNASSGQQKGGICIAASGFTNIFFAFKETANANSPFTPQNGDFLLATSQVITIQVRVPIAQWSTNTVLASDQLIQSASNSDATNTDNLTAFSNGVFGEVFPTITLSAAASFLTKRVRFSTPHGPYDRFTLKVFTAGSNIPRIVGADGSYSLFTRPANGTVTNFYGMSHSPVNTTDCDVLFGRGGRVQNSPDNAGIGAPYGTGSDRWVLERVSPGGDILMPINSRNISADTTGTTIPAGLPGYRIQSPLYVSAVISGDLGITTATQQLLPAGNWRIIGRYSDLNNNGVMSGTFFRTGFVITTSAAQNWEAYANNSDDLCIASGVGGTAQTSIIHLNGVSYVNLTVPTILYMSVRTSGHSSPATHVVQARFTAETI